MRQRRFARKVEFQKYGRKSRQELSLDELEVVVPWSGLLARVLPRYVNAGNGRRPVGLVYPVDKRRQVFPLPDFCIDPRCYDCG